MSSSALALALGALYLTFLVNLSLMARRSHAALVQTLRSKREKERLVAKLSEISQQAEAANRAKSEFLANISHELRTPLNGVIGALSVLADTPIEGEQKQFVGIAQRSAELLLAVINDVLDLSRIEAGQVELQIREFDPRREELADHDADRRLQQGATWLGDPTIPRHVVFNPSTSQGLAELAVRRPHDGVAGQDGPGAAAGKVRGVAMLPALGAAAAGGGVLAGVAWVAFKVGALSFGGGFVIIPLMRADAVGRGWMTSGQFLNAVALGQITPGPVVLTVSAVGYAAAGVGGALLAALVAFSPSFAFVLGGAGYFSALRTSRRAQWFLDGAGPAAIGAILGSAVLLAGALSQPWQYAVLAGAAVLLLGLRRGVVFTLLAAAAAGMLIALAGGPLPH